ncbi:MAG: hypothetical protein QOE60_2061 [Thermoleophilaceae bacterium]|nr:hypothetical protein [Thermoleophilaceae bacterium]
MLWALAFAKPLFDVLADSPEFFVARGNTRGDILLFAIAIVVAPPALLVGVEALLARWTSVRLLVHSVFVGGLVAAFAVQVLDDALGGSGALLIALAVVLGAAGAVAYRRTAGVAAVLTVLGPAPLVILLLFLLGSGVSKLVLPRDEASAADGSAPSRTPVVLLVFDEFDSNMLMGDRGHRIDATRYPNLAALGRVGTWYPNATTVNSQTTLAVPALLSGRRPTPGMLPISADYPNSIFTLLGASHQIHAIETATQVCPEELCGERAREPASKRLRSLVKDLGVVSLHLVAPAAIEHRLPAVDQTFGDFGGGGRDSAAPQQPDVPLSALTNRPAQFTALVDRIRAGGDRPGLYFLHAALPHIPWQYLPSGEQYLNAGPDYPGLEDQRWSADGFPARLGLQRHLLQAAYADRMVGRIVARLRAAGIYDEALVVVTADHGVSFRPGEPRRKPTPGNLSDIASVPLLIKYPNRPGGRIDDSFVRTLDVVPTIAAELGVKLPWEAQGRPIGAVGADGGQVSVREGDGAHVETLPFGKFVAEHEAGLQRMLFMFGAGDGTTRLYANGANADLLGRRTDRLRAGPSVAGRVELDSSAGLDDFRPGARLVPSFVSGRVQGAVQPGQSLAVSVNGTIRGVTESFAVADGVRLAAIVPASSFQAGPNAVRVFAVQGEGSARRLAPIATQGPGNHRLVERDGATTIQAGGQEIAVQDGAIDGFVDSFEPDDLGTRLGGWAVDVDVRRPAERILVFAGGRLVAQAGPTVDRGDIAAKFGPGASRSGFEVRAPVRDADSADFRVFAIRGDRASELRRYGG